MWGVPLKIIKIPCYLNTWSIQVAERADQGTGDEVEDDSQLGEKSTRAEEWRGCEVVHKRAGEEGGGKLRLSIGTGRTP